MCTINGVTFCAPPSICLYIRVQPVLRSKHCPPQLYKTTSLLTLYEVKVAVCFEVHNCNVSTM